MRIKSLWTRTKLRLTPPLSTLWLLRAFLSVAMTFPLKKHTDIYIYHMYCLLKSSVKTSQEGNRAREEMGSKRHAGQRAQGRTDIPWRDRTACWAPDIWILYEAARQTDFCCSLLWSWDEGNTKAVSRKGSSKEHSTIHKPVFFILPDGEQLFSLRRWSLLSGSWSKDGFKGLGWFSLEKKWPKYGLNVVLQYIRTIGGRETIEGLSCFH